MKSIASGRGLLMTLTSILALGTSQGVQAQIAAPPIQAPAPMADDVVVPDEAPIEKEAGEDDAPDLQSRADGNGRAGRDEKRRRRQEKELRKMMTDFGVVEAAVQDALIEHIGTQVRTRVRVRQLGLELYSVLGRPGLGDVEVHRLLAQYQEALDANRIERARADSALNDKIDFRSQPRLEAMLMLFGIVGDNPVLIPFAPVLPDRPRGIDSPDNRRGLGRPNKRRGNPERLSSPDQWVVTAPPVAAPPVEVVAPEVVTAKEITGVVVGHAPDAIVVQLKNGEKRTFNARTGNDGNDEPDEAEIARAIANFEVGARVRLRWIEDDAPRIVSIERLRFDAAF